MARTPSPSLLAVGLVVLSLVGAAAADDISVCKVILTAVELKPDGTTLFCPSTDAFTSFADDLGTDLKGLLALARLPANKGLFKMIMQGHVVPGRVILGSQLKSGQSFTTLGGVKLNVVISGGDLALKWTQLDWDPESEGDGATDNIEADIDTTDLAFPDVKRKPNYVIHSIDNVIVSNQAAPGLTKVAAAL